MVKMVTFVCFCRTLEAFDPVTRIINSRFLIRTQHSKRIYAVAYMFAASPAIISLSLLFKEE